MYIDLTMEISDKTPPFPGDPKLELKTLASIAKNGCNEKRVSFNTHFSTHIDAPFHMLEDGKKLNEFPIETFIGDAQVFDVRDNSEIKLSNLTSRIQAPIVLFRTEHTKKAFESNFFRNNPVISVEVANKLATSSARIVGIDSFTPDNYPYTVHKILFKKNILIVENLVNLESVGSRCKLFIAPLNLKNADGAPARVFADVNE